MFHSQTGSDLPNGNPWLKEKILTGKDGLPLLPSHCLSPQVPLPAPQVRRLTTALSRCAPSLGLIFPSDFSPLFSHPIKRSIFKVQKNIQIVPMRLQAPAIYRPLLRRGLPKHLHAQPCSYEAGGARFIPTL